MTIADKLDSFAESLSTMILAIIIVIGFIGFMFFNVWLGILFVETGYPGTLFESQYRFSGPALKSDFSVLISNGTLNDYILIQYLDIGIMVFTAVCFFFLTLAIAKKMKPDSSWRKRGFMSALLFPISSLLDGIENIVLLTMLANPLNFPDGLALVYSSLAVAKFAVFIIGLIFIVVILIAFFIERRKQ